jgi:hypothetical protein
MNWLLERVDRFWPDWAIMLWTRGAIAIGAIFVLIATVLAVRHYGFGHLMVDGKTHEPFTHTKALMWLLGFGGPGALFLVLGILTHRWKSG